MPDRHKKKDRGDQSSFENFSARAFAMDTQPALN